MCKGCRLGMLEVSKTWHDRFGMLTGKGNKDLSQFTENYQLLEHILPDPDPQARTNLIIPGSSNMESSPNFLTDRFDEEGLDTGVDILELPSDPPTVAMSR